MNRRTFLRGMMGVVSFAFYRAKRRPRRGAGRAVGVAILTGALAIVQTGSWPSYGTAYG